jgi:hypothetical protein
MSRKSHSLFREQSGMALVIALIMMVILTLIGLASTFTSTSEIMLSGHKRGSTDAFYAADGGVQATLANPINFESSTYTLVPSSSSLQADLWTEPIDKQLSPPVFSLPAGINFSDPPQVTIYHLTRVAGEGTQGYSYDTYIIDSVGRDQMGAGTSRSTSQVREKWVMRRPEE